MMKKNKLLLLYSLIAAVLLVGGGCYYYEDATIINNAEIEANYKVYNNVSEMVDDADIIMRATITDDSQNILNTQDGFTDGYTLTKVHVDKIIKGDKSLENSYFTVSEPTYVVENGIRPGKTRFSYEEYSKLVSGSKYFLLLKQSEGNYWVNALHQGKYNIDNTDKKEKELYSKNQNFKILKDDILNKFSTQ